MRKYDWAEVYETAKASKSEETYTKFVPKDYNFFFFEVYKENEPSAVEVFDAMSRWKFTKPSGFYVKESKWDNNGHILPKGVYNRKLMYHKKWARRDIEVEGVTYDIVGYKRKTTNLPCAVLIANVKFNFK